MLDLWSRGLRQWEIAAKLGESQCVVGNIVAGARRADDPRATRRYRVVGTSADADFASAFVATDVEGRPMPDESLVHLPPDLLVGVQPRHLKLEADRLRARNRLDPGAATSTVLVLIERLLPYLREAQEASARKSGEAAA